MDPQGSNTDWTDDIQCAGKTTDQVHRGRGNQLCPVGVTQSSEQERDLGEPESTVPAPPLFLLDLPGPLAPETVTLKRLGHTTQCPSHYKD